jgi:lipopolysaccharide assembly protein B
MQFDVVLIFLLVLAIGIGWILGRLEQRPNSREGKFNFSHDYFIGLNYLLNEQPDEAIEVFIKALELSSDTVETQLALGSLFRRRGDVDRATGVHQHLLARPTLEPSQRASVTFELARDYMAAGLLDRAENLLIDIAEKEGFLKKAALESLLKIYEGEKEWGNAIAAAQRLVAMGNPGYQVPMAHYACELVDVAMRKEDYEQAHRCIKDALKYDTRCARASFLLAELERKRGRHDAAIIALKHIAQQNAEFVPETIEPLIANYDALGQKQDVIIYLREIMHQYPSISVALALSRRVTEGEGERAGAAVIADYVRKRPSLTGLNALLAYHLRNVQGDVRESLELLRTLAEKLIADKPAYQCSQCGFQSKMLYWQCPSCKQWGSGQPTQSSNGIN